MARVMTPRGTTSEQWTVIMQTTTGIGTAKTGLVATNIVGMYYRKGGTAYVALTFQSSYTLGTYGSGAWNEITQGAYVYCPPNIIFSSTASSDMVTVILTATAAQNTYILVDLTNINFQNSVNAALTSLPTVAANTLGGLPILGTQIPTSSYGVTSGLIALGIQIPTASAGFAGGFPTVQKQIPTATAGAVGGLIMIGDQVPTASAGLSSGLPTVGLQIPTGTAGAVNGLPLLGLQIHTASAGAVGGLPLLGTQLPSAAINTTGGLATIGNQIPTGAVGTSNAIATVNDARIQAANALSVDTYPEPSSVPSATVSLATKIGWLQFIARNRVDQTASQQNIYSDAGVITATASVSDNGTTFTRQQWN